MPLNININKDTNIDPRVKGGCIALEFFNALINSNQEFKDMIKEREKDKNKDKDVIVLLKLSRYSCNFNKKFLDLSTVGYNNIIINENEDDYIFVQKESYNYANRKYKNQDLITIFYDITLENQNINGVVGIKVM